MRAALAAAALAALIAHRPPARRRRSAAARCSRRTTSGTCASTRCRSHPQSSAWVATIGAGKPLHPDFGTVYAGAPNGIPYVVVPPGTPKVAVTFDYDDESDAGPYPIPPDPPIEGGPASSGDRHVLIVESGACRLYELFAAYRNADGSWRAGSGAIFDLASHALRPSTWTSADAAGLPILPGLVRYDEVAAGAIAHALRFTAPQTRGSFVWPARHEASSLTGGAVPADGPALPAEGRRRPRALPAVGAPDPRRAQDLRDDARRQRLVVVPVRRARPALGRRRAARAEAAHGRGLRGGRRRVADGRSGLRRDARVGRRRRPHGDRVPSRVGRPLFRVVRSGRDRGARHGRVRGMGAHRRELRRRSPPATAPARGARRCAATTGDPRPASTRTSTRRRRPSALRWRRSTAMRGSSSPPRCSSSRCPRRRAAPAPRAPCRCTACSTAGATPTTATSRRSRARDAMLAAGWIAEGYGPDAVAMCAIAPPP